LVFASAKSLPKSFHSQSSTTRSLNTSTRTTLNRRKSFHYPPMPLFISNHHLLLTTTSARTIGRRRITGNNNSIRFIHRDSTTPMAVKKKTIATVRNMMDDTTNYHDDKLVIRNTEAWIEKVVINLNLCPFAEKSRSRSEIYTSVVRRDDVEEISRVVLRQCLLRKDGVGTSVVVCPDFSLGDFRGEYMEVLGMIEEFLGVNDLDGHVQIAPFHPLFEFSGSGYESVDNLTNRSPYPIFHILREEEVSTAVRKIGGDSSKIWKRNVSLLEAFEDELGREKTEMIMKGDKVECMEDVLKRFKEQ